MAEQIPVRQVLIDAKLSGTQKYGDTVFHYSFRTNEQAADAALAALAAAGIGFLRAVDPTHCYECGEFVNPDEGEAHGRAGRIHFACMNGG